MRKRMALILFKIFFSFNPIVLAADLTTEYEKCQSAMHTYNSTGDRELLWN